MFLSHLIIKLKTFLNVIYNYPKQILDILFAKDSDGQSLLHIAAMSGQAECADILLNFYEIRSKKDRNITIFNDVCLVRNY